MEKWQLVLAICIPLAAVICLAAFYYLIIPKFFIKKIRQGKENLKYPDNFTEIADRVQLSRDLTYASAYPNNLYDFYKPKDGKSKGLLLWIHGGFFIAGDKKGVENVCYSIAANGYCVASINYVTAPEYKYPTALKQTDEAVGHILNAHSEYADNGIIICGDSAGGNIAAQYAALVSNSALQRDIDIMPVLSRDLLKGAVLVCAPIDIAELRNLNKYLDRLLPIFGRAYFGRGKWYKYDKYKTAALYNYIDGNFPNSFITDGNSVSFEGQNKKLSEILVKNGVYCEALFFDNEIYGKVNHEYLFDLTAEPAPQALIALIAFLNRIK